MNEYGRSALNPVGPALAERCRNAKPGERLLVCSDPNGDHLHEDCSPPYDDPWEDAKYALMGRKRYHRPFRNEEEDD